MNSNTKPVAFVTGASRGIGAETAVALAAMGYRVAITARTLSDGESHDHSGHVAPLPGSLEATALAIQRAGGEALTLRGDVLEQAGMVAALNQTLSHWGRLDLLFNNAIYQGAGNVEDVLEVTDEQVRAIYQGNVFTPLALVQAGLPQMLEQGVGTIINMVSHAGLNDPPAPASKGGWSFAYSSSKAAFAKMVASLRVEHPESGLRFFNIEPGTVITELMKKAGIDKLLEGKYPTCQPAAIASVIAWLVDNDPEPDWQRRGTLSAPLIAKHLGSLRQPSYLETSDE